MLRLMCYSKKYILEEPLPSKAYFYTMFVILDPSNHLIHASPHPTGNENYHRLLDSRGFS